MYAPQCLSIGGTSIGDALATGIQAPAGPCKLMAMELCDASRYFITCSLHANLYVVYICDSTGGSIQLI